MTTKQSHKLQYATKLKIYDHYLKNREQTWSEIARLFGVGPSTIMNTVSFMQREEEKFHKYWEKQR